MFGHTLHKRKAFHQYECDCELVNLKVEWMIWHKIYTQRVSRLCECGCELVDLLIERRPFHILYTRKAFHQNEYACGFSDCIKEKKLSHKFHTRKFSYHCWCYCFALLWHKEHFSILPTGWLWGRTRSRCWLTATVARVDTSQFNGMRSKNIFVWDSRSVMLQRKQATTSTS